MCRMDQKPRKYVILDTVGRDGNHSDNIRQKVNWQGRGSEFVAFD